MGKHLGDKDCRHLSAAAVALFALHGWGIWQSGHSWSGDLDVHSVTLEVGTVVNAVEALLGITLFYVCVGFFNTLNASGSEHL